MNIVKRRIRLFPFDLVREEFLPKKRFSGGFGGDADSSQLCTSLVVNRPHTTGQYLPSGGAGRQGAATTGGRGQHLFCSVCTYLCAVRCVQVVLGDVRRQDVLEQHFVERAHRLHLLVLHRELGAPQVAQPGSELVLRETNSLVQFEL